MGAPEEGSMRDTEFLHQVGCGTVNVTHANDLALGVAQTAKRLVSDQVRRFTGRLVTD